ncbi:MAG: polysaccharide deacetylase family protein [Pseudomonadota bacterium]
MKKQIKDFLANIYYVLYRKHNRLIGNRILLYHSIGTSLDFDTYGMSISKELFTRHINYLVDNFEIISVSRQTYDNELNRETVSISFDDGFKDNLYALELLEKKALPFSLYITTGYIGKKNYLDKREIQIFSESKFCTIGSHGTSHYPLSKLDYQKQYIELSDSKKILEDITGKEIRTMSYPHGAYNNSTIKALDDVGYNLVSSSHFGINTTQTMTYNRLKRIEMIASDDLVQLQKKLLGYYDYLALIENFR